MTVLWFTVFILFNQEMVITIFLCCFSALLFPIVRRHLISTYILHVGQLDTHFLSWWMKSHSSLSIHYISQTTSKKKVASFYTYLIKLQYKLMPVNRIVRCVGLTLWYYVWKQLIYNIWYLGLALSLHNYYFELAEIIQLVSKVIWILVLFIFEFSFFFVLK